jgi:hypothetical protein
VHVAHAHDHVAAQREADGEENGVVFLRVAPQLLARLFVLLVAGCAQRVSARRGAARRGSRPGRAANRGW